jgi:hypothetical protein
MFNIIEWINHPSNLQTLYFLHTIGGLEIGAVLMIFWHISHPMNESEMDVNAMFCGYIYLS